MRASLALPALSSLFLAGSVLAQEAGPHAMQIEARQGLMNFFALNLGVLGDMAKGDLDYDPAAAGTAATNLATAATLDLGILFPPGSDNASVEGTRALPEIWAEGSEIGARLGQLQEATAAMAAAAGTDLAGLQAAMAPLGEACTACHRAYRATE